MKKLYAAICLTSALLLSGCKFFLNQNDDETNKKTPDPKPTFEYTADNDVPASQAPFDKNVCSENADSLEFSDGDWTIVECLENPDFYNEKEIAKASAKDNTLTINSGILKLDIPFDSEKNSVEELPASEDGFEAVFTEIQEMWTTYGYKEASKYTFKNGYLTNDNTIVLIIDATEIHKEAFDLNKLKIGTIKSNPNKTKYVVTLTQEQSGREIPVYIYKDATLNDKETIPGDQPEDDTQDDLTDIVKALDYSECKTSLTKDELSFADGDWEIVVDEETLIFSKLGTQRTFLTGTTKNNNLELKSGKGYFFISTSYYENSENKKTEFKADLDYFEIKQNKILMNDKYLVNDLGDLTDDGLSEVEHFLSSSNLSAKSNLKILANDSKSKYKLTFGNWMDEMYTVYFNKVGGTEVQEPQTPPSDSENPEEQTSPEINLKDIYTAENDVPANQVPFDVTLCTETGKAPTFSNGDWKIVDITEGTIYNTKAITDVSFTDGDYNCSSIVCKYDFPRNEANEVYEDDFEKLYKEKVAPYDKYDDGLSHGYLTDDKIVLIAKNRKSEFEEIYLAQLNAVSAYSEYIYSNKDGTKYIIPYNGNGYYQTIYVFKVNADEDSEEDLGYTVPTLPASVGEDPFKGKTFADESHKYVFGSDGTFTVYLYNNNSFVPKNKSAYAYNADTKLLTSHYVALLNEKDEFVSFNEYKQSIISMVNQKMANESEADKKAAVNALISMTKKEFEKTSTYKAELVNGKLSLQTDYFTEVPDIKNLYLVNITCEKVNNSSVTLDLYGESNAFIMGLGRISLEMPYEGGTYVKRFDIYKITDNTIEASGENEIWWEDVETYKITQTLIFTYSVVCNSDGRLTFTISGNDAVTKAELGATESNPNPSYQLRSKGASILEVVTE